MSSSTPPTAEDFRAALTAMFAHAARQGHAYLDVRSGDLHRHVGMYPGPQHRMPVCCSVMQSSLRSGDEILRSPPSGQGANLVIRYSLPR